MSLNRSSNSKRSDQGLLALREGSRRRLRP